MDSRLFNATGDRSIRCNLAKGFVHQQTLYGHDGTVSALCCGENPDVVFSGGGDNKIIYWKLGDQFAEDAEFDLGAPQLAAAPGSDDSPIFKRGA